MRDPNIYEETRYCFRELSKILKSLKINLLQALKNNWNIFQIYRDFCNKKKMIRFTFNDKSS